jgi:hypothetical protein
VCKDHDMMEAIVGDHDPNAEAEESMPDDGKV